MAFLVAMFAVQTFLVYSDNTGRDLPPLSDAALEGRTIWLSHNCQSCHQFYGFGGFLGPDLTNASRRLDRARLDHVLTEGVAQMPPFHLSPAEISAVEAYLREMDGTGVGQARAPRADPRLFDQAVRDLIAEGELTGRAARGAERFLSGTCAACHGALTARRIGTYLAPDLSTSLNQLSDAEVLTVLAAGRPARGMPPTGLDEGQRGDVVAFLRWQAENRERLRQLASAQSGGLPWWEFR